ncbi:MAG: hypothetical protein GX936_10770 [Clostridiales bacterium]|nr:hypothetical protein [Clostridiales bacterium]
MQDIPEVLKPSMDPDMLSVTIREAAELNTQNEWDAAIEMGVPYEWATRAAYLEEALAHRDRALEWACDRLGEEALTCPDAPFDGCHAPDDYDCAGHWREAALAATEEVTR